MEDKLSCVAKRQTPSPIQQLSFLAQRFNAINLAEGFPDFPAPPHIKNAAVSAINSDFNQYRHVQGICDHIANRMKKLYGLEVDPLTDIVICCGQSGAFAAAMFAVINPGDEVILFDPCYETYETSITLAGGLPVYVPLEPPHWTLNKDKLMSAISIKTKALVLNSPHNPTGKVFTKDELDIIAEVCRTADCFAITDEVYEHITYDDEQHISVASLPGMQIRTIITSSLSKTFGVTGWRIGWAVAPSCIASAIRNIHIRLTDSAPAPFQEAALMALSTPQEYYESLKNDYQSKRDYLAELLLRVGFVLPCKPKGSFFIFAELPQSCVHDDVEFVEELIKEAEVVAVPGIGFFHMNESCLDEKHPECSFSYQKRYIRFAFCKSDATLASAAHKIGRIVDDDKGHLKIFS